ncbi:MAG: TrmB family transcriptional regulator [Anaerolineae bacterium]|nr:TrmB family transcriptional regulator [Anaerolineae bacterium]
MPEDITLSLKNLGFTEYESKAYLSLLRQAPLSGYAVARDSGVPRSKIYEVLDNLVSRGDVFISHGEPVLYSPKPPQELIESRRLLMARQLQDAQKELELFQNQPTGGDLIWDIRGRDEIFFRFNELIGRAAQQILLQIWQEDFDEIRSALAQAAQRGVKINIVAYGPLNFEPAGVYIHEPGGDEITREYGGRWAILSVDGREIVTGIVSLGKESRAAWSAHLGIVMPITEQIKHDLYLAELLDKHRDVLEADFGPALVKLRDKFGPPTSIYRPHQKDG